MRLAIVVVLLGACTVYDPVDDIPHREYRDTGEAVRAILRREESRGVHVYAVGEYHPTRNSVFRHSPLARFSAEIVGLLEPRAQHMVVEAWLEDSCRSTATDQVAVQVAAVTGRPQSTGGDLAQLITTTQQLKMETHGLPMTCIEHSSVLDGRGRVDFLRLLLLVTEKLHDSTRALVRQGRTVIVYGGALHNDLYPRWPLEELSYAQSLAAELGGGVLELDLVVPEIVAPMAMVRREDWFPLLGRASPDRVIVWARGPGSYVIILPARDESVAKVAKPIALM